MDKKPTRKCLVCKTRFEMRSNTHWICSIECSKVKGNEAVEKKKQQLKKSEWTKEKAEIKKSLLTHADYLKMFETVFNTFIRLRDKNDPCISCGTTANVKYDAGHFWACGNYSFLRFHEDNVNKQCSSNCNLHKRGNFGEYRIRLIQKIGVERVQWLDDNRHNRLKLSIPEIQDKIKEYKLKIKELKNLN